MKRTLKTTDLRQHRSTETHNIVYLPNDRDFGRTWFREDDVRQREIHEAVLVVFRGTLHHDFNELDGDLGQGKLKEDDTVQLRRVWLSSHFGLKREWIFASLV